MELEGTPRKWFALRVTFFTAGPSTSSEPAAARVAASGVWLRTAHSNSGGLEAGSSGAGGGGGFGGEGCGLPGLLAPNMW